MNTGMIEGGLEYIVAAYGIVWAATALYTVSLVQRARRAEREAAAEAAKES